MSEYEIADTLIRDYRSNIETWPGVREMLAEAVRCGRGEGGDDEGREPIGTESENAGLVAFLRGRRTVRDLQRRAEAVVPSGASTRADDPGCVWLRFSAEDAARIQEEGAFAVVQGSRPERVIPRKLYVIFHPNAPVESMLSVEDERGESVDSETVFARYETGSWETLKVGPLLRVSAAGLLAEAAIGLFVEEVHRRGAMVSEAIRPGTEVAAARDAAVAEVVQGVEAGIS